MVRWIAVAALIAVTGSAHAAKAQPLCASDGFPDTTDVSLARVTSDGVTMRVDGPDCASDPARCTGSKPVGRGLVVAAQSRAAWRCVLAFDGDATHVGWVEARALAPQHPHPAGKADWIGSWRHASEDGRIVIRAARSRLVAQGGMTKDFSRPGDEGDIRTAGFEGSFTPRVGWTAPVGACRAELRRLGPYLVVHDEAYALSGRCGGDSVSFSGVYRR